MPNKAKGKSSAQYYKENPASKAKKAAYDKKNDKTPARKARRAELTKIRIKILMAFCLTVFLYHL